MGKAVQGMHDFRKRVTNYQRSKLFFDELLLFNSSYCHACHLVKQLLFFTKNPGTLCGKCQLMFLFWGKICQDIIFGFLKWGNNFETQFPGLIIYTGINEFQKLTSKNLQKLKKAMYWTLQAWFQTILIPIFGGETQFQIFLNHHCKLISKSFQLQL